jgi:hypothetical protein
MFISCVSFKLVPFCPVMDRGLISLDEGVTFFSGFRD